MVQKQKRRRKKKLKLLLINYEQLSREEILATLMEIRENLKLHFRWHLGEEEPTSPAEIFEKVLRINPQEMDTYKREYWWNVLKKVMSGLRKDGELFIIHRGHQYFVLRTQEEANYYKNQIKKMITGMHESMKKADAWVREEKWKKVRRMG